MFKNQFSSSISQLKTRCSALCVAMLLSFSVFLGMPVNAQASMNPVSLDMVADGAVSFILIADAEEVAPEAETPEMKLDAKLEAKKAKAAAKLEAKKLKEAAEAEAAEAKAAEKAAKKAAKLEAKKEKEAAKLEAKKAKEAALEEPVVEEATPEVAPEVAPE